MTLSLGGRVVQAWTSLYTKGLPAPPREARRREIDSDLWEHYTTAAPPRSADLEVLGRWLLGIPSDLSWRVSLGRTQEGTAMKESLVGRLVFLAAVGLALVPGVLGATVIAGGGEWDSDTGRRIFGALWIAAAVTMVGGLLLSRGAPRLGPGLVAAGVVGIALLWFWIPMITLPVGLALLWLARQRGKGAARPGNPGLA